MTSLRDQEAPGNRIGPYAVVERLGAGGMGAVLLVRHVESQALYALKLLSIKDAEGRLRFQREAEAMVAAEGHLNVARIHTIGREGEQPYLVMEYLSGGTLAKRLRQGPLPVEEALDLVRALADGLEWVHGQGVLHRDLKPGNVLFAEDGTPKLVDFGLARLSGAQSLTRSGTVMGTPSHMAPEQVGGQRDTIDARADVYGLGAILYHCLTGSPPIEENSTLAALDAVLTREPPPPSTRREGLDPSLDAVCARALAKKPSDRFPTAADLRDTLGRARAGDSIQAPTLSRDVPWQWVLAGVGLLTAVALPLAWPAPSVAPRPHTATTRAPSTPTPPPAAETPPPSTVSRLQPLATLRQAKVGSDLLVEAPVGGWMLPDGRVLTWGITKRVRLWPEPLTEHHSIAFELHSAPSAVCLAPSGVGFYVGYHGATHLELRSFQGGARMRKLRAPFRGIRAVAASPDGKWIAAASYDASSKESRVGYLEHGGESLEGDLPVPGRVNALAISATGRLAAVSGDPKDPSSPAELLTWELPTSRGSVPDTRWLLPSPSEDLAISASGYAVAIASNPLLVGHVDTLGVPIFEGEKKRPGRIRSVALSPQRSLLLLAEGRDLVVRDATNAYVLAERLRLYRPAELSSVRFAPDGERVLVGRVDGHVEIWSTQQLIAEAKIEIPREDRISRLQFGDVKDAHDFFALSVFNFRTSRDDEALTSLGKAIELDPHLLPAYALRARVAFDDGKYQQAVEDLTLLLRRRPRDALYELRGSAHHRLGSSEAALADFDRALQMNAHRERCYLRRGRILKRRGQRERADADLREALERFPPGGREAMEAQELLDQ